MRDLSRSTFTWLTLLVMMFVLAAAAPLAAAAGPQLRGAPLSAEFLRYQADFKVRHTLGLDRVPSFRPGLVPAPMDPSVIEGALPGAAARASYPSSYDLRDHGKLSPVKDQGANGTCWAFATFGSLESCLLPGEPRDFSEDNVALTSGFDNGGDPYGDGGNFYMSAAYLIRWSGPVDESEDAYADSYTPPGLSAGKHVQEVLYIPGGTSPSDTSNVKYALTTYGAVGTSIRWEDGDYASGAAAFYYAGTSATNHAVTIIGWDDAFAASRFASPPPGPGAWLVKNSWGTGWGQGGCFWVSYYDPYCGTEEVFNAVFKGVELARNYGDIYSYDPLGQTNTYGYGSTTAWGANVFRARRSESVAAVGFFTHVPNTTYTVYAGASLQSLQSKGSGSIGTPGFHTVGLSSPHSVTGGGAFVVAVRLTSPGNDYPLAVEYAVPAYSSSATSSPGQSFASSNGSSWTDLTSWKSTANVCLKAYTTGSGPLPTPTPTPTPTPSPTPTPPPGADDDVPGMAVPASPFGGSVARDTDRDDVYRIALEADQTLTASITGPAGSDFRLYLYAPGTASVKEADASYEAVAWGTSYPCSFSHTAAKSGTYYLDVYSYASSGGYTVTYFVTSPPPDEDTIGPICRAKSVTVTRGKPCKLYFSVLDEQSAKVTKHLVIAATSGVVKKSWSSDFAENYDGWWYLKYTCRLPKGTYRIIVTGEDLAGNGASVIGRATLKVK